MAKKKVEEQEEIIEQETKPDVPSLDPVTLKANQIIGTFESGMVYEGVTLDLSNPYHKIVAAWLVGRGGWLRR